MDPPWHNVGDQRCLENVVLSGCYERHRRTQQNDRSQMSVAMVGALKAAGIIAVESVKIASSLPIDKCFAIMEKQLIVICTDGHSRFA
jgi:hypothetical protein